MTGKPDQKKTAIDLMRRVTNLTEAHQTLSLPYTYDLIRVDPAKKSARVQLGMMTAEIIEDIRDQLMDEVVRRWLTYRGLTRQQAEVILPEVSDASRSEGGA